MKVYYDKNLESTEARAQPWDVSKYDKNQKYYDFKKEPQFIKDVLEDFKPWERYEAIQLFYDFLYWLNTDSALESNDAAFRGPENNTDLQFNKKLKCSGRVMIFYKDLRYNISKEHIEWLRGATEFHLRKIDPTFEWGVIGLTFMDTYYRELKVSDESKNGKELMLSWWAYGDSEEETMFNLKKVFGHLFEALKCVSNEII